ncbi:type III polyketide synthase [Mucisphaera sp.]|uniref:type III polyketide synthase n=1 Tax=Mucisphaera sp. TaxID=2913024 RepID=UPI003D0D8C39
MPDLSSPERPRPTRKPPRTACLAGMGIAHPPYRLTQPAALNMALPRVAESQKQRDWTTRRYQHTGIGQRYSIFKTEADLPDDSQQPAELLTDFYPPTTDPRASPSTAERLQRYAIEAPTLVGRAASLALADADLQPEQIDHLVVVSCTGMSSPGVDLALIERLGLRSDISRTLIGFMGCHGAIDGLHAARSIALAHPSDHVLLVCVEICTLHFQHGFRPSQIIANSLFGDAAAALVLTCPQAHSTHQPHESLHSSLASGTVGLVDTATCTLPNTSDAMTWTVTDHGFQMTLDPGVPEAIRSHLKPWLDTWLQSHGIHREQIAHWLLHPGGPRILDTLQQDLALSDDQLKPSRTVLHQIGNVSSGTVLFVLQEARRTPSIVPGPAVMLAFGPGLTMEAALLELG